MTFNLVLLAVPLAIGACVGCVSSASSFVPSSVPLEQRGYSEVSSEVSGVCTQVQWLFFTFGKAGSPQRHAYADALEQVSNADALTAMAVDIEQFSMISTSLLPFPVLPVVTKTRVTGTPVRRNAQ